MDCRLHIADICFRIRSKPSDLPDLCWRGFAYRHFLPERDPGARDSFRIDISAERAFIPAEAKKIFDCDGAYSLHVLQNDFFFVKLPFRRGSSEWLAKIRLCENTAEIFFDRASLPLSFRKQLYNPVAYPFDQVLTSLFLADRRGVVLHSAGCIAANGAWMFLGRSGAGKSTITKILSKSPDLTHMSDDRIIVRQLDGRFFAYGTPWPGEAGYATNRKAPLAAMFFLEQGKKNEVVQLTPREAVPLLLPVSSIPWYDRAKVESMLDFCDSLVNAVPMYRLLFRKDDSVLELLSDRMISSK